MRTLAIAGLVALAHLLGGCASTGSDPEPGEVRAGENGTEEAMLARLAEEYWEGHLEANPEEATYLGIAAYDDRLSDLSPEGRAADTARIEAVLGRARAIPAEALGPDDRISLASLIDLLENQKGRAACRFDRWVVDPLRGPQVNLLDLVRYQKVESPEAARKMVSRWRAMGPHVRQTIANLKEGKAAGTVAVKDHVEKVLGQLDRLLEEPVAEWTLLDPAKAERPGWSEEERTAFLSGLTAALEEEVRPSFEAYREFLRDEILPVARPSEKPGLVHLPGGAEAYGRMIRAHTSLDLAAEEIHRIGLDEVARIRAETSALGKKVFGIEDVATIQEKLRTDPALHFRTRDEVEAKAVEALRRAEAAMPGWFGILPEAPCTVKRMAPYEEKESTIAFYSGPAADGSRPGAYYVNTYAPETRPRYEAEVLAFHEAIPGHHLQIAIAQELDDVPEFRKHEGVTAFVEGWALYSERVSEEMGLYTGDLDRFGILSFDAWRACRLVVDTGMHALGWTRQQAIDYMLENTLLAENNIVNEVDRYITWPGQALAYKLGQLEILRLRAEAEEALGEAFDVKWFHDRVLENGAVSLPVLRAHVEEATAARLAGGSTR